MYDMIAGRVVLKEGSPAPVVTAKLDPAAEAWGLIRNSNRAEDFDDFAAAFPNSDLVTVAKLRATQLRRRVAPAKVEAAARAEPASRPASGTTYVNPKDGLTYVWIPAGTFTMGCSAGDGECYVDEQPAHEVTLTKGFWIGQTEVTQEAFEHVTGDNPSKSKWSRMLPVESVTWNEAKGFCATVGMRLPTEAEWEYAARGGSAGARYGNVDTVAWYRGNSGNLMHEVGQKQANGYGLYDMLGNVEEWVADWGGGYAAGAATNPQGPPSGQLRAT